MAVALFDYEALGEESEDGNLAFAEGDIIEVRQTEPSWPPTPSQSCGLSGRLWATQSDTQEVGSLGLSHLVVAVVWSVGQLSNIAKSPKVPKYTSRVEVQYFSTK